MITRRLLLLVVLFKWSSLLSSIFVADAKLMLWSSLKEDDNSKDERTKKNDGNHKSHSIRDRLKSFHKQDESAASTYVLSPTKYMEIMFHYIQSNIRSMSEYLYNSDPSISSSQSTSSSSASTAYALFRHARYKDLLNEPKDAWEGILSALAAMKTGYLGGLNSLVGGVYELGYGTISACLTLFGGGSNNKNHNTFAFLSELAYGIRRSAEHASDGLYLFAAGAVVGTRNLVVGIARTPHAMYASQQGMMYYAQGKAQIGYNNDGKSVSQQQQYAVWDYYSLDYEDREIQKEEERLKEKVKDSVQHDRKQQEPTRNVRRRRATTYVKDKRYYDILGVKTDANSKEIRSAYRKEALKRHPDKQSTSSSSQTISNDASMPDDPHIEGFLDLTEAYRILSNDASRDAYDMHGVCFREETALPEDGSHEEYVDLIDELFGANAVKDYVGTILIAPIVNEMFGFSNQQQHSGGHQESAEVQNLKQRRRTVDVAKNIRDRVNPYIRGEITKEEFTISCREEANLMMQEGGGESSAAAFIQVIGRTLLEEADQRIGYVLPFVRKTISDSSQKVKSSFANARVYAPIYFRAALEGLDIMGSYNGKDTGDPDDCSSGRKSNKEAVDQDAVLDLLWHYVVNDSVATLRGACEKVFADRGARDASLAFIKAQSPIKFQRAEAVRILAREMLAAGPETAVVS